VLLINRHKLFTRFFTLILLFSAYFTTAPISNVLVVKPTRRQGTNLSHQPPLSKYLDSPEGDLGRNVVMLPQRCWKSNYLSAGLMGRQLRELQVNPYCFWYFFFLNFCRFNMILNLHCMLLIYYRRIIPVLQLKWRLRDCA
jgi:hypothetical protein